jgi:hypothetical protein
MMLKFRRLFSKDRKKKELSREEANFYERRRERKLSAGR